MPTKPRTPKAPRTRKTPQQKAEQALGVAERRVAALTTQKAKFEAELATVFAELKDATRRRDYLAQSPDLPTSPDHLPQPLEDDEAQDSKETP
jgi:hypothetical protein